MGEGRGERLCLFSRRNGEIFPGISFAQESVEDGQEFAHACDQGDLGFLAGSAETFVVRVDRRVTAGCRERGHVKAAAYDGVLPRSCADRAECHCRD